jgi:hypothetical protein
VVSADHAFAAFDLWIQNHLEAATHPGPSVSAPSQTDGTRIAQRRRAAMEDLIRSDPRRALELAIPDSVRATLPASVAVWIEERVSGRGDFEVLCAYPEPGREAEVIPIQRRAIIDGRRFHAFVYGRRLHQPTLRDVSLHGVAVGNLIALHESPVRQLPDAEARTLLDSQPQAPCANAGDHAVSGPFARVLEAYGHPVHVCGPDHAAAFEARLAAAGDPMAGEDGAPTTTAAAAAGATQGRKRLIFIRVDFSDLQGESLTTTRASELTRELHGFFQNNSYGRAGFLEIGSGSDVTPVLRLPRTAASYGSNDDAGNLRADALEAARNAGYVLSDYDFDITCMRSVPGFGWAGLGFVGAPGAWIRGTSSTGVTAHELGHNIGLNHANFWDTEGPTITGRGSSIEYGDKFDTMGAANAANNHFNARYKRLLGWLQPGEFTVVTTNGTYRLHAHDVTNAVTGTRGLQIFANPRTNYWVEFRQRFTSNRWLFNGVGIRWAGRGNESSLLLDTTPDSPRDKDDSPVTLGRTFSDTLNGIHITPVAKGGSTPSWIDVVIQRGTFPDNRPPTLTLHAPVLQGSTSDALTFEAEASDPDGDDLAYFWEFGDESLGTNTPAISHRWSITGEHVVHCTVSDTRGGIARATAVVRIGSPSTLRISGRITADGEPIHSVRVTAATDRYTFTDSSGAYTLSGLNPGSYTLSAHHETTTFQPTSFSNPVTLQTSRSGLDFAAVDVADRRPVTLVAAGSSWRYWDRGTSPGSSWAQPAFNDTAWDLGPAILGYGGDRETTVISYGTNASRKHITTWFRRTFNLDDPASLSQIRLGLLRDDGAVVHLNGRELFRDNLPSGTITASTLASSAVGGTDEVTYFERDVDPARLVAGTNTLAVEIHQSSATSSDKAFDLRLTAERLQAVQPGIRLVRPSSGDTFTTPGRVVLSAAAGDIPGPPLRQVTFLADNQPIGTASQPPFVVTWQNPAPGEYTLAAHAILDDSTVVSSEPVTITVLDAQLDRLVVPRGSRWRYLDSGVAPAASWTTAAFDDSAWAEGPARLGYGEDGEFTVVGFGSNPSLRHVTTWFRHSFQVPAASLVTNLVCRLARDDGAVVYLNGQELFRSGIRAGILTPTLLAQSEVRDEAELAFLEHPIPTTGLVEGRNVLAVEVHQASRSSSDLGFDLELLARYARLPESPRLTVQSRAGRLILSWPSRFTTATLERSPTLGPDAAWQPITAPRITSGDLTEASLPLDAQPAFYRLRTTP